ncbi:uncharacterized protein LOC108339168 isoform X4 [Vigna angularis]|uniref:uncharacterized protein LOC108339168 isoform X4 n=1 Tax=Phaseolus angularis TaxID=3914 RepID=UPI0022B5C55B|nr:uncharacterized protein LOC108339168 isoform X4 [Vigna angularis]
MTPAVEEDHHDPSLFHDSNDRLLSSCSCSTSASDDDAPTPQNDTKPIKNDTHALPQFPFPTMCKYDAWISEPSSLSERRSRLLRQFGLPTPPSPAATIPRSSSSHQCTDTSTAAATIPRSKSDNTADRGTKHCKSSVVPIRDNDNGFLVNNNININSSISGSHSVNNRICVSVSEEGGNGEGNVVDEVEQACTIRDLDNGKEFVVKRDGVWNEVKEVGTGRRLTVEEFEMTVGHSPIVQELMRRQSAEEGRDGDGVDGEGDCGNAGGVDDEGDGGKVRRKGGWFKFMSLKSVVVGQKERRSGDERDTSSSEKAGGRRSSSATDDSQDGGSGLVQGGERVRVRQYGKSCKEVTGLYKSQKIQAHVGSIWSIKFSLDGKYLASAGEDCVIHVWRVLESERKGELLVEKPDDGNLNMLFVVNGSPEPSSPGMENNLEKKRRGRLSVSRKSLSVDQLVVPETVFALTDKPVCTFKGHLHDVLDLSWSKSQHLLSSSMDKTVRLWHLSSKSCLKVFAHSDYVTCIQFNPADDRYFISGSLDAKVRIWSIPDRQVVDWTDLHEMVTAACYTPDGQGALVGTYKGSCHSYNTSENKLQQKSQINLQNRRKRSNHKKITGFQEVHQKSSSLLLIPGFDLLMALI